MVITRLQGQTQESDLNFLELIQIIKKRIICLGVTFGGVFGVFAFYTLTATPIYEASGTLLVQQQNQASRLSELGDIGELGNLSSQSNPLPTQINLMTSNVVLKQTVEDINSSFKKDPGLSISLGGLKGGVEVSSIRDTNLMRVVFRDSNPKRAVIVVNQLMKNYVERSIDISRGQKRAVRGFIESQIPVAQDNFETALTKLRVFREERNITDISAQTSNLVTQTSDLQKQILDTQVELSRLNKSQAKLQSLLGMTFADASILATLSQADGVQMAIAAIQSTQTELDKARSRYTAAHPSIQALERQLQEQQQTLKTRIGELVDLDDLVLAKQPGQLQQGAINLGLIQEQITNDILIDALQQQLSDLSLAYQQRQAMAAQLPKIEQELVRLQVDVETTQARFTSLLSALQDARIAENQDLGNVVITQPADEAVGPVSPKVSRNLLLGALLGLILGVAAALSREYADQTLHSVADLQQIFPTLNRIGFVPDFYTIRRKSGEKSREWALTDSNVFENEPLSLAQEAYRMLFANIRYSNVDENLKVLALTSCVQSEGKSTTTVNLAFAMAELGLKVLVLDLDLRLPSQHTLWEIPNKVGLTSLFFDGYALKDVLHCHNKNLDVITTGPIPPSPLQLIESKRFADFVSYMRKHYDYILFDLPPLSVATESVALSQIADGTILVARLGVLKRPAALNIKEVFIPNLKNVIGLVINSYTQNNNQGYYYYQYYKEKGGNPKSKSVPEQLMSLLPRNRR